jgi:hypothetical protein
MGMPTPPSTLNISENFEGRVWSNISCQQIVQLGNYLIDISTEKQSYFRYNRIFKINLSQRECSSIMSDGFPSAKLSNRTNKEARVVLCIIAKY